MEQIMFWFWLVAAIVLAIVEAATATLVTIWFAGGAFLAMLCAWAGFGYGVQLAVFVISSMILLLLTRPLANKLTHRDNQPTNADRIIGQTGVVTEAIDQLNATGRISVMGQSWAAVSEDGNPLEAETKVIITEIRGVKAVVKKGE